MITFAAVGDVHGQINRAAELLLRAEQGGGEEIRFALQVGDMEPHRSPADLKTMYAPFRKKEPHDFPLYAEGKRVFPRPMYFIGGNHEPYGYLEEGPKGMTLAPNLHYLGRVGALEIDGLRVAFLSGIYNPEVYESNRSVTPSEVGDEDWEEQHTLACFTKAEVELLANLPRPHVLLVHVWPFGLVREEDHESGEPKHRKLRYGETGVPLIRRLAEKMGPQVMLCGHLHRHYRGLIDNQYGEQTLVQCLGNVQSGNGSVSLFRFDGKRITE